MGSMRGKRAQAAQPQQPNKRLKTSSHEDGNLLSAVDMLQMLPSELLLLIVGNLTPRECQPLRLTCKALRDVVNATVPDTLTVTNDIAQYIMLEQVKHCRSATHVLSNGWVARLLGKFPRIKKLDVKCSQNVLTLFARHMVRDCLGSVPPGSVPPSRIHDLADNVKTNSRRHSAVLLCELMKFKVAQSLASKPLGYDAMRQDVKQYVRADQMLTDHRIELQGRVVDLVEKVLTLKGHADARAHEHYKYARDTLDDSLLQLVSCLQHRHSKYAYQLLAKAADPAKAARGWRWLFYFLARQKQAEAAIEAYKVVDKQALASLSPTCLSELFRSLIENEITTQPEPKLRAITSESGSWTKFLYRGNFTLTSTQNREGALEKVATDLIMRDYLETTVNVMNRFETESTAKEIWVQLLGALGIAPGGEMPLVARDLHRVVNEQVTKAAVLAMQALPARRVECHVPLVEVLVAEGHLEEAFHLVSHYPEQGALDKCLLKALSNAFALADCPPAELSSATCALLLDVLQNRLHDVAARSELTTVLVAAYAARKELDKAVQLASSLDEAAASAIEAAAGAAGGPVEPVPAAAAPGAAGGPAGGGNGAGNDGVPIGAGEGDGAGARAGPGPGGHRVAEMWRGVAAAAVKHGHAEVLLAAMHRVNTSWLLGPAEEDWGLEVAVPTEQSAGAAGPSTMNAGVQQLAGSGDGAAGSRVRIAVPLRLAGVAAGAAGPSRITAVAQQLAGSIGGAGLSTIIARAQQLAGNSGGGAGPSVSGSGATTTSVPSTVWQRVCGVLLRAGRQDDLVSALRQLLAERRRGLGGHSDQRALLESTVRAMLNNGCAAEALALARSLGGGYASTTGGGCCSAAATPRADVEGGAFSSEFKSSSAVRPCWCMLNIILEGYLAKGEMELVLQELLDAGAAQSRAAASIHNSGSSAAGGTTSSIGVDAGASKVMPAAAGRLRQSLLTDVISLLTEAGRTSEAVQLLRVLRGGENEGSLIPLPVPVPAACAQRDGSGSAPTRTTRPVRTAAAAAKRNRANSTASAAAVVDEPAAGGQAASGSDRMVIDPPGEPTSDASTCPQPQYNRLLLEGSGDEEVGQAADSGSAGRPSSGSLAGSSFRAASLEAALSALVKALQKRSSASCTGSATQSGSSAGAAASDGSGLTGGSSDLLVDWLEVCKAWPLGPSRDVQLDSLARRAMDKGRDLDIALQAGWLLGEASPQELRYAYTHRDLAQKCIGQGMLDAAQACLMRIKQPNWEDAADSTARELMRALARSGDKATAQQLAGAWIHNEDQRATMLKSLRAVRPATGPSGVGGAASGSRAGSSSRGSSRHEISLS